MKKFIMITPLYPVTIDEGDTTRYPLIALINTYAEPEEEIRVFMITPDTDSARIEEQEFRDELADIQAEKGFVCRVEAIHVTYANDVDTQLELFRKLLPVFEKGDTLYACMTFGSTPMSIVELMAIEYAYRVVDDVAIGTIICGDADITSLIRLDEIVRMLATHRIAKPMNIINKILDFGEGE